MLLTQLTPPPPHPSIPLGPPPHPRWVHKISYLTYAYASLLYSELDGLTLWANPAAAAATLGYTGSPATAAAAEGELRASVAVARAWGRRACCLLRAVRIGHCVPVLPVCWRRRQQQSS